MIEISETRDLAACLALRREVFVREQGVPEALERDSYDAEARHLLACDGEVPVGTARVVFLGDTAKIGRVCVLETHRGTGLGAGLIGAALDLARGTPGTRRAVLGAQNAAIGFYERLGFTAEGGVFMDAGIPHRMMARDL